MEDVRTVGVNAFAGCPSINEVALPSSLVKIGSTTFSGLTFQDADGNVIKQTAKALRGHTYSGTDGVLKIES